MSPAGETRPRLLSLDVFRGLTMAAMVLVNNPGAEPVYEPLDHAEWHGWTFTDLVFPFFLWIVGVALTLSFARRGVEGSERGRILLHALRRSAILFGIGLAMALVPRFHFSTLRIPGVLQRIAVCAACASAVFLYTKVRGLMLWIAGLLAVYWVLMMLVPVPGYGPGVLTKEGNFARWVDGMLLSGHMWVRTNTWDPEGVVSTLPAIATTLFGVLAGHLLGMAKPAEWRAACMLVAGNALLVAGSVMSVWMPVNKNLWTASYSVFMAGMAGAAFGSLFWLVDIVGWRRWARPFEIFGRNAIAIFVLSGMLAKTLMLVQVGGVSAQTWIYRALFAPLASPRNASLLYALAYVGLFWLLAYGMYRRRWFVKF